MSDFLRYLHEGGVFMYPILLLSIIALSIVLERVIYVVFRYNINGEEFMAQVHKFILSDNIDRAIKLCNADENASLAKVLKAGLIKANQSEREIQNSVDEAMLEVLPKLNKRTHYLATIANVSTLLGLLGTIQGLIHAFSSLQLEDVASRSDMLAQGISIAMYTTAFGLVVAIPCMLCYGYLQSKTSKIIDEIDQYSVKTINLLTARTGTVAHEKG